MGTSIARALVCATGLAVVLGACSVPPPDPVSRPEPSATGKQADQTDLGAVLACTQVGNAEGVSVDLADVLDLEGGDYFAQVSVPAQGTSNITGFAGNDSYYPGGGVAVDLDGGPVTVDVVVRDEAGQQVYTASGTASPQLNQPNGAACDGENYYLFLLATTSGDLVPLPWPPQSPRLDARGRESIALYTACAVNRVDLAEGSYARVGGVLGGPDGPPPGWNAPYQRGWATRDGDQVLYTDDAGHRETFRLDPNLRNQPACS